MDSTYEKEGTDRMHTEWPGVQSSLSTQLTAVAKNPIIVIIVGGGGIDVSSQLDSANVGALL